LSVWPHLCPDRQAKDELHGKKKIIARSSKQLMLVHLCVQIFKFICLLFCHADMVRGLMCNLMASEVRDILLLECYVTKDIEFMFVCFWMMLRNLLQMCLMDDATIDPLSFCVVFNLSVVLILP